MTVDSNRRFHAGQRVRNGKSPATVKRLVADDFLEVVYDDPAYQGEPQVESAMYFEAA